MILILLSALAVTLAVTFVLAVELMYQQIIIKTTDPFTETADIADSRGLIKCYFMAIMQAMHKPRGVFLPVYAGEKMIEPDEETKRKHPAVLATYVPSDREQAYISGVDLEHWRLDRYKKVIGYTDDSRVMPPLFLSGYFNRLIIAVGASQLSRIRVLGVVHLSQEVTMYSDCSSVLSDKFDLAMKVAQYRRTNKGLEVDLRCRVYNNTGMLVWESTMTGLSLQTVRKSRSKRSSNAAPVPPEYSRRSVVTSVRSTGFEYARIMEDWQPQHINRLTAKMVGFDQPIAHGMWSMAVAMNKIITIEKCYKGVYPLRAKVSFRRFLKLGDSAVLRYTEPESGPPSDVTSGSTLDSNQNLSGSTPDSNQNLTESEPDSTQNLSESSPQSTSQNLTGSRPEFSQNLTKFVLQSDDDRRATILQGVMYTGPQRQEVSLS